MCCTDNMAGGRRKSVILDTIFDRPKLTLGASIDVSPLRVTCGRRPGKNFLTFCSIGRVRSRVRPVDAAGVAAGPNALGGSGPKQTHALWIGALTQAGSPDPRNNRICITSSCPRQLVLPI
jgi:hypothetical protein